MKRTNESPESPAAEDNRRQEMASLSKRMSHALRHRPESLGIVLDEHGWCAIDALVLGLQAKGIPVTRELLEEVVRDNDKRRFVISANGTQIRAAQGHSVSGVMPLLEARTPPATLFHGTTAEKALSIARTGLLPMRRHHVHLSIDRATAAKVGARRGPPVILTIDCKSMVRDGIKFYVSANGVWLVDSVHAKYVTFPAGSALNRSK